MRQTLRLLSLIAFLASVLPFTSYAQPHFTSTTYFVDSCYTFYTYTLTNATAANNTNCKVENNWGDGTRDTTLSMAYSTNWNPPGASGYGGTEYHEYVTGGTYTIKKVLLYLNARVDSVSTSVTVRCTYIGGHIYQDVNTNCVYNAGTDAMLANTVHIQVDSAGVHVDTVSGYGTWVYHILASAPTTYTFKMLSPLPTGFTASCPSSSTLTYAFSPSVPTSMNQDFGFNCSTTPGFDLKLYWSRALRAASSSGPSYISMSSYNSTCQATTGTLTLQVSPKYSIMTSGITPTPASVSGNTITWTFTNMVNGLLHSVYVPLTPLSTTANGDTACTYAIITPLTGDLNVANNVIAVCDSVRNSWDPNHKSVSPDGSVAAGALLNYYIQFENLGNDTAFNVHVQDTLSANVDANTFDLTSASHPVSTMLSQLPDGRTVVKFDLTNIRLADKTHPLTNNGAFAFTVKAKAGLAAGTTITNQAGIYFDANPVVMTNTAYNKIGGTPAGVITLGHSVGIQVYPNPATDAIMIRILKDEWSEVSLANAFGQIVAHQSLAPGNNVLNIQNLPAGIYYLQAKGSAGRFVEKIEKQ